MDSPHRQTRRTFLKHAGIASVAAPFITHGLMAQSSSMLRHASFGAGGMAWADITELTKVPGLKLVAVAEVDSNRTAELKKQFPEVRIYQDWRKLLEKEASNIDSVNVSTPDHMHASIAMRALQLGKHVYCQKPLAHDLFEVRKLATAASRRKLVTQMGVQVHATGHYKKAAKLIQDGVIGKVREVHCWCPKSWGDTSERPERSDPVPPGFDWELWLGICASRPFIGGEYYHPGTWRKRLDFGTGTLGDMGCHLFDPVFSALDLHAPIAVRSEGSPPNRWNWPLSSLLHYAFAGTKYAADKVLPVTWYDGTQKPPPEIVQLLEGDERPEIGSIFVGTEGAMVLPHVGRPQLYPDKKFADFKQPAMPDGNHWQQFVEACLGKAKTSADFSYSGPLTEAVLAGCIASRFPQTTLRWNSEALKFDLAEANAFVRRAYREGWQVEGLG